MKQQKLDMCAGFIKRIGLGRNRGYGRCVLRQITNIGDKV